MVIVIAFANDDGNMTASHRIRHLLVWDEYVFAELSPRSKKYKIDTLTEKKKFGMSEIRNRLTSDKTCLKHDIGFNFLPGVKNISPGLSEIDGG
ncbi:hypothetical protein CEXT_92911 [Caerostris extrusa]|uniref:DNA-directed RNA polymerase n=1 Tax=Caerostris extrusa TaxID=172846 RepID=A0AAV4XAX8_CAEEX|nr:hypothetical protein CEXT_92911 [Caerostris extrusa]